MKIDFYIFEEANAQRSLFFACQLIEKMHAEQKRVFVNTNSASEAEHLDTLLWTFKEDSFIPHTIYQANDDLPPPIQIGYQVTPQHQQEILLNLTATVPEFYQQFSHVIEIVHADPQMRELARERFKQYRDQGNEINTHKLK